MNGTIALLNLLLQPQTFAEIAQVLTIVAGIFQRHADKHTPTTTDTTP